MVDQTLTITDDESAAITAALTKISTYAQTDGSPVPTLMDYTDADLAALGITEATDLSIFHYTGGTDAKWEELARAALIPLL